MEIVVQLSLLATTLAYLVCDHCIDCKSKMIPGRKRDMNRDSIKTKREVSDLERAPVCGRVYAIKQELRRDLNETIGDYIQDDSQLDMNIQNDSHLEKILGGTFATPGEFPWVINIQYKYDHYCGGAIISEFWVVTAAHCVADGWRANYVVTVGEFDLAREDRYEVNYHVQRIVQHEKYTDAGFDYDIALLKISPTDNRGIIFNNYVQPICLAYSTEDPKIDLKITLAGWGITQPFGELSSILKKTSLPVVDYVTCFNAHPKTVTPNYFCAGYFNGDTTGCSGDSGSPGMARSSVGMMLYGVFSFARANCMPANPPAFTSIPRFRNWIDDTIRRNSISVEGLMPPRKTIIM